MWLAELADTKEEGSLRLGVLEAELQALQQQVRPFVSACTSVAAGARVCACPCKRVRSPGLRMIHTPMRAHTFAQKSARVHSRSHHRNSARGLEGSDDRFIRAGAYARWQVQVLTEEKEELSAAHMEVVQ